jgi:hypothetical protein
MVKGYHTRAPKIIFDRRAQLEYSAESDEFFGATQS